MRHKPSKRTSAECAPPSPPRPPRPLPPYVATHARLNPLPPPTGPGSHQPQHYGARARLWRERQRRVFEGPPALPCAVARGCRTHGARAAAPAPRLRRCRSHRPPRHTLRPPLLALAPVLPSSHFRVSPREARTTWEEDDSCHPSKGVHKVTLGVEAHYKQPHDEAAPRRYRMQ